MAIAKGFQDQWQFPNCIGAIDGKHVVIQASPNSGSSFFNYKGTFSVVLMALVDAEYCFTLIDVGAYGSQSDGGIFALSAMGKALQRGPLSTPPPKPLPGAPELGSVPHVIVGDEAFPLKPCLMRPFPGQELNNNNRIVAFRQQNGAFIREGFSFVHKPWIKLYRGLHVFYITSSSTHLPMHPATQQIILQTWKEITMGLFMTFRIQGTMPPKKHTM